MRIAEKASALPVIDPLPTVPVGEPVDYLSGLLDLKCFNSIAQVDEQLWNNINGAGDIFNSYKFLKCLEASGVDNSRFWYLIFYYNGIPVGSAVLSQFIISIDLLSGGVVALICDTIRKIYPRFMKVNFLFCGTPISIGKNNLRITDKKFTPQLLNLLIGKMRELAEINKINILCLKEFDAAECAAMSVLEKYFTKAPSLPYVKLYIDKRWSSFNDYLTAMRSPFRRQVIKSLKKLPLYNAKAAGRNGDGSALTGIVISTPRHSDAQTFYKLYLEVMKRAKTKMELLNQEFFEYLFNEMPDGRLVSLEADGEVLGTALVYRNDYKMTFLLIGMNYEKMREYDIYFNLVYNIISLAVKEKIKVLEMGQTSYYFKQRCGGVCEDRYFYIRSLNKPLHFILSYFNSALFPQTPTPNLHVFTPRFTGARLSRSPDSIAE